MEEKELIINPKVKIHELLENYPQLEEVLITMAPVFKKLKNPMLRRTIARVTTLQQAAVVGNVSLEILINKLRQSVGQEETIVENIQEHDNTAPWFDAEKICISYNAIDEIESGGHPLDRVLRETREMKQGDIYELITAFVPAPLIDKVGLMGFGSHIVHKDDKVHTYFIKK